MHARTLHTANLLQVTVRSLAEQVCVYTVLGTHSGQLLEKQLHSSNGSDMPLPVGSAVSVWTYNDHEVCVLAIISIVCANHTADTLISLCTACMFLKCSSS
jgi:hypothetical protein